MFQTFTPPISVKFHHAAQPSALTSSDVPRFRFPFGSHALGLWCMRRTRLAVAEGPSGKDHYRSVGDEGIVDASIFAPSLQGKLQKLGFYDSFMVCSCLLYPLRFTSSLSQSCLLHPRHCSCSKLQALSFAKSSHTSSTSFSAGQVPEIACSHANMVRECLRRVFAETLRASRK